MFHPNQQQPNSEVQQYPNPQFQSLQPLNNQTNNINTNNNIINNNINNYCNGTNYGYGNGSEFGNMVNGNINGQRNRRELKLEREELTGLFTQLISVINEKVCFIEDEAEKLPKPGLEIKGKSKSIRERKDQTGGSLQRSTNLSRKQKEQQKNNNEKPQKQRIKQQIFSNYSKIMSYKLHEDPTPSIQPTNQHSQSHPQPLPQSQNKISTTISRPTTPKSVLQVSKGNKQFCVVQEISLIVNSVRMG